MGRIYDLLKKIPFFNRIVISSLVYLGITLLFTNLSWPELRLRIPMISKVFYVRNLSFYESYKRFRENQNEIRENSQDMSTIVDVVVVQKRLFSEKEENPAILEPVNKTEIFSKVSGRIEKLYVKEGDKVSVGTKLLKIDSLPYELELARQKANKESSLALLNLAREKLVNAERLVENRILEIEKRSIAKQKAELEYKRALDQYQKKKIFFESSAISNEEFESMKLELAGKEFALNVAEKDFESISIGYRKVDIIHEGFKYPKSDSEKLKILKIINTKIEKAEVAVAEKNFEIASVNLRSAEVSIKESLLTSPIDGYVAKVFKGNGVLINPGNGGEPIMLVIDISKLIVSVAINERDISRYKVGQETIIEVDSNRKLQYSGRIISVNPSVDPKTHTAEVKIEVNNKKNDLKPGMFVRAETLMGAGEARLFLPKEAIIQVEDKAGYVFVIKEGRAFKIPVKLGTRDSKDIEITSGLDAGIAVAKGNLQKLYDGIAVKSL